MTTQSKTSSRTRRLPDDLVSTSLSEIQTILQDEPAGVSRTRTADATVVDVPVPAPGPESPAAEPALGAVPSMAELRASRERRWQEEAVPAARPAPPARRRGLWLAAWGLLAMSALAGAGWTLWSPATAGPPEAVAERSLAADQPPGEPRPPTPPVAAGTSASPPAPAEPTGSPPAAAPHSAAGATPPPGARPSAAPIAEARPAPPAAPRPGAAGHHRRAGRPVAARGRSTPPTARRPQPATRHPGKRKSRADEQFDSVLDRL